MSPGALALILGSAVAHASWNLVAKRHGGGALFVWLYTLIAAGVMVPVAVAVALVTGDRPSSAGLAFMAGSGLLHAFYFTSLQWGYRHGDLSVVYPLARGTGPALAIAASVVLLHEHPSAAGLAGGILIVVGVLALAAPALVAGRRASSGGVWPALLTGCLIAAYTLWDAHAIAGLGQDPFIYFGGSLVAECTFLSAAALRSPTPARSLWEEGRSDIVTIGLLSPLSYVLVLAAFALAPVAYVAPGREVGIVLATVLGGRVLGEAALIRKLAAGGLIVADILLLALA